MDKMANNNAILRGGAAAEMSLDELFGAVEQEWQDQALCAQTDPEAFFPEKGGSTREAKRICQACAVRDECLEYALEHDERIIKVSSKAPGKHMTCGPGPFCWVIS